MMLSITSAKAQVNSNLLPDSGNVGIGTTTPSEKLEVNGNAVFSGNLTVDSVQVQQQINVSGNVNAEQNLTVSDTLTVGGSFNPRRISEVEIITGDTLIIRRIISPDSLIFLGDSSIVIDDVNNKIYEKTGNGITLLSAQSASNGKYSLACGHQAIVGSNCDYSLAMGLRVRSMASHTFIIGEGTEAPFINNISNSLMVGFNTTYPTLFVGPNQSNWICGNVGIGNNAPNDKLQIGLGVESITFGSAFCSQNGWIGPYMGFNASRTRTNLGATSIWTLTADGNNNGGMIISGDAAGKIYFIPVSSTNSPDNQQLSDAQIKLRELVILHPRVVSPSDPSGFGAGLMEVNGNIVCRDLRVTLTGWWDDVFKDDYPLMSLPELEQYIIINGCLPDVPSTSEAMSEPMSLQEMNLMLLKKVEELTLYVIDLQKQVNELNTGGKH